MICKQAKNLGHVIRLTREVADADIAGAQCRTAGDDG